jgi:hypothetical protein
VADFTTGPVTAIGGFRTGDTYFDDPYPTAGRGAWFDGNIDHYTLTGLVMNHSFTVEFFLRSFMSWGNTGSLFSSFKDPYDRVPGADFSFNLRMGHLSFFEKTMNESVDSDTAHIAPMVW